MQLDENNTHLMITNTYKHINKYKEKSQSEENWNE